MRDKILEMANMQHKLNQAILKEYDLEKVDDDKLKFALFDELGELVHELKGDWCWWRKSQKPVDWDKVLEELVDVWHFALTVYLQNEGYLPVTMVEPEGNKFADIMYEIQEIASANKFILFNLVHLTIMLGFSVDDVYDAYIAKNKVNYERLENNY